MTEVITVKFKGRGKQYYFSPDGITVQQGQHVIVDTAKGMEYAEVIEPNHEVPDDKVVQPLRRMIRIATANDDRIVEINLKREQDAMAICRKKIEQHKLDMKLVDAEYSFEGNKIMFFFTSDGRVDFRELVKDLASEFRTRIELRQIGVRDEAKMLGGIGICGRPYCCNAFLNDFHPVSTKMAKVQNMSLNPTKISGACGRLMCCLRYGQEAYEELVKAVPKNGAFVETPAGYGVVSGVNVLRSTVKVRLDGDGDAVIKNYYADEIAVIPGGRPRPGEPLPQLLKDRPKPNHEEPEPEEDPWEIPQILPEENYDENKPQKPAEADGQKKRRNRRSRGGKKPAQQQPNQEKKPEAAKPQPREQSQKPRQQGKPRQKPEQKAKLEQKAKPDKAQPQQPKAEGETQKRRRRPRRRKSSGGDSAPKAE